MEATLEDRAVIEGSATEISSGNNPPAESGNTPVTAEQANANPNNQVVGDANCAGCHGAACGEARYAGHYRAAVTAGSVIFWSVMTSTPYRSVSDGMESADVQLAFEALKSANYDVRINKSTGRLEVPENDFQAARIFLASQGIPRAAAEAGMGSLADGSSMTTSQFMEQVKYNNAIEIELARTISEISTIETARVT